MEKKCSNCRYWQHGKCTVTGEVKHDGVCTCGRFQERKENK